MDWTRREFVRRAGSAVAGAALLPASWPARRSAGVAVLGSPADDTSFARGAVLGLEEAERSATLLRSDLALSWVPAPTAPNVGVALRDLRRRGIVAVVSALPDPLQAALEQAGAEDGMVILDARATRPAARSRTGVFRTGLPAEAYEGARARAEAGGLSAGTAVLWHDGLFRYGAEQLNERFRRRFGLGMDGGAWASWMAVKTVTETLLREPSEGPEALSRALVGRRAAFDGHKGVPLTFTAPGGTLSQPLYVVTRTETVESKWPMEDRA